MDALWQQTFIRSERVASSSIKDKIPIFVYYIEQPDYPCNQSEAALENGLIKTLMINSYERVFIKEEENLKANFKVQLEKHNQKALALIGRGAIYRQRIRANSHLPRRRDTV